MKCQRRILKISWRQFVRNSEISALTDLPAINDVIRHRRIAVFGHIARLQDSTPAHKALQSHVNLSLGRLPHPSWSRRPGRRRGRWIDQIRNDTSRHLPTSEDRPLDAVIMDERRDGPRWLCDDDDDDMRIGVRVFTFIGTVCLHCEYHCVYRMGQKLDFVNFRDDCCVTNLK